MYDCQIFDLIVTPSVVRGAYPMRGWDFLGYDTLILHPISKHGLKETAILQGLSIVADVLFHLNKGLCQL